MLTCYWPKISEPALIVKLHENFCLIKQRLNTVVGLTPDAHAQCLSKKSLSFCTHETYPSSTSKDDDKGTEKDPETNAYEQFSTVFNECVRKIKFSYWMKLYSLALSAVLRQ